ncbi:hypothetical protein Lalb_Chr14g0367761 [Lupinus albus]|uniref:Uncharacterized protein n=1 Tax=Lupinus albus TaxID=3870 RepID=A0A6A4P234_LUPAL|nr:hypothetical protein Lalb_Chr14g0367761 [Lupinus albus]
MDKLLAAVGNCLRVWILLNMFSFRAAIPRSRYLAGIQEILAQIAVYSFESLEQMNYSVAGVRAGENKSTSCSEEKEWSDETSFIQKQRALQQLKSKYQLWRPQKTSISVLRASMFQNFLHP